MGAAVTLQEQVEFQNRLRVTEGYAMAVRTQAQARRAPLMKLLVELRRLLGQSLRSGDTMRVSLRGFLQERQDQHEERELQGLLSHLHDNVAALRKIVGYRASLIRARRIVSAYWTDDLHERLLEQLEDVEDLTETLALGLSPAMRQEIAQCREEAGLSDAVAPA